MIVGAWVTVLDRYGVVIEDMAQRVTLRVDGTPDRPHHVIVEFGERAIAVDIAVVRQVLWLGHRRRAFGALLEVDVERLRVVDAAWVDITPIDDGEFAEVRVRAGRFEVVLALADVAKALAAPPVVALFAEPVGITRH
ncbi:MAG TPA: hypothetical protein PL196_01645 [Burkholderiaceae bacterium]|nr:hypothetical protein [Burkholderiaceae bacterium]